ncbi:hypothetical protein [uncultured Desulfuromonas sp.]|uniref:hypothetical protein n=1 Tax=uncultured Desulfuromonas sp. TaxID=181013 RepID=UPI002624F9D7|nr:hypothetical protein [uncultured Desulfuromonas sp.]
MIVFEIFRKRRTFAAIFNKVWPLVSAYIPYPPDIGDEPEQQLVFTGALVYGTVYQSALAAGTSTSAAHYLARMHLRNYKFDSAVSESITEIFAGSDDAEEQEYTDLFQTRLGGIVETVRAKGDAADPADIEPALLELSRSYRRVTFTPE